VINVCSNEDYAAEVRMTKRNFLSGTLFIVSCACSGTSTLGNGEETGDLLSQETLDELCGVLAACASSRGAPFNDAACEADIRGGRDQAVAEGCGGLWDASVSCGLKHRGSCEAEGFVLSPECNAQQTALEECIVPEGPGACAGGGSGGPPGSPVECEISCEKYSADCSSLTSDGPVTCLCRSGPGTGTMFEIDSCDSEELIARSREACM
jgi:hypothetical protein